MNMHLPPLTLDDRPTAWRVARAWLAAPARRRALWVAAAALLVLGVWLLVAKAQSRGPVAPPSGPPTVTVVVPGLAEVRETVSATGTIAARRELPVGVVGEGGAIVAVRTEAGRYVKAGEVLAEINSGVQRAQLAQLQAAVGQARADARLAAAELDRARKLVERGFVSQADLDRRQATLAAAQARVAVAEAQVREMRERIARLSIRAPEAGLVLSRHVEEGQVVSPASGALFRIAAGGRLEVRAEVPEADLQRLRVGEEALVTPTGSDRAVKGRIWLIEPVVDPGRRLGVVRIDLPTDPSLRAGGFASVTMADVPRRLPRLPQSAVLTDADGAYVYVVDAGNRVRRQPVKLGSADRDGVTIVAGLAGPERVVASAGAFLRPGEEVTPVLRRGA